LGDVIVNKTEANIQSLDWMKTDYPNSKFNLIIGNYDEDKKELLSKYFDTMQHNESIDIKGRRYYMDHYPKNCFKLKHDVFSLTGHIHGLWKVQKNMINVGVDAWHFKPVSEDEIDFCRTACEKYYDENVFPY
jgi:calcineurin-like phosphoesterase family protein